MTNELTELGKRAVASPHWRWMPGMLTAHGSRVISVDDDGICVAWIDDGIVKTGYWHFDKADPMTPDMSDPATLGCLEHLVREAWAAWCGMVSVRHEPHQYTVTVETYDDEYHWPSERVESALVAALEAAP